MRIEKNGQEDKKRKDKRIKKGKEKDKKIKKKRQQDKKRKNKRRKKVLTIKMVVLSNVCQVYIDAFMKTEGEYVHCTS
jgi:hypothetical protein